MKDMKNIYVLGITMMLLCCSCGNVRVCKEIIEEENIYAGYIVKENFEYPAFLKIEDIDCLSEEGYKKAWQYRADYVLDISEVEKDEKYDVYNNEDYGCAIVIIKADKTDNIYETQVRSRLPVLKVNRIICVKNIRCPDN